MIPPRSEDWEIKLAEQGLDLVKAPTEEEIENGPIMNHEANFIVEAADFNDVEQSWDKSVQQNPRTEFHSEHVMKDLERMGDDPEHHPVIKKVMGKLLEVATHHDLGLVDSDQAKHVIRHARKHGQLVEKLMDHLQQATMAKAFHSTAKEVLGPEDEKGWGKILDRSITDGCASWHEMHHQLHHDCKKSCGYWGIPKGDDCTFCKDGCPFCDQDDPGRFASIKKAEGLAGSNDQLYMDPIGTSDGPTGPSIQPTPLTDQGTSTETLEKKSSWITYSTDMAGANTPITSEQQTPTSAQGYGAPMESGKGGSNLDSTGLMAPDQGQSINQTLNKSQQASEVPGPPSTGNSQPPAQQQAPAKPSGGGINWLGDIAAGVADAAAIGELGLNPVADAAAVALTTNAVTSSIKYADGDENIPGSTQPSLGQNESTMERHVNTPFTQPSKQTSDRGTTPQTNSPSNTNAISLDGGQKQNAMNPLVDAISPEGNENIIMNGSKSSDYLEMITKEASDSEIYFKGFSDGKSGVEMDKSLSNLSDDYFNGWQDGKIYIHAPIDEIETHLIDMKPGANALPEHMASVDSECDECGSIRVAHCGTCEGSSEDLKETTENVEGPAANAKDTQNMQVAGSVSCKACYGSGIVCMDCGCSR